VSTMIMAEADELLEIGRLVWLARREIQIHAPGGTEHHQKTTAPPLGRGDGSLQDPADLLFHRHPVLNRPDPKPIVGFVVQFADAQARQGHLREIAAQSDASTCWQSAESHRKLRWRTEA